jgi:Amt family ammonium transporter
MRKVVIIFNAGKFESLKNALEKIDITGITVSYVSGCGTQHGSTEYYRGSELELHLLPKIKVEIVISTVPLALLIDTAKAVLHTGNIGDGKIFVYEVSNVIKIRTGEEGQAALE